MRKIACLLLLSCLGCVCSHAQRTSWLLNETTHDEYPVHFGFALGLNTMDCAIEGSSSLEMLSYGFSIQAVANFRLHEYLDLRTVPGISFGDRNLKFGEEEHGMRVSYVDIPLLIKYKSHRTSNVRPYVTAGGSMRYLLNKIAFDLDMEGEPAPPDDEITAAHKYDLELQRFEPYFDAGAGVDFYLPFFKFTIEFRGSWGLQDCVRYASERSGIRTMKPSVYSLVFYFE